MVFLVSVSVQEGLAHSGSALHNLNHKVNKLAKNNATAHQAMQDQIDSSNATIADLQGQIDSQQQQIDDLGGGNPGEDMGSPLTLDFTPQLLVSLILVEVLDEWLDNPNIVLHIEITGLNGNFELHGTDDIPMPDTNVWFSDGVIAHTIVDWTADTVSQNVNEVYTVCVEVLENGVPVGLVKCVPFGPF